ncbi:uncharacterized protein LOC133914780 [Phragmites australis]|uniref:uncharacterized protein LOC133914780 n=1 Tax=Phragmites australis TaxID=29695 RepID=UPI002D785B36|nr:uncharacterized protein LOC133914780 [Phragmites australis]
MRVGVGSEFRMEREIFKATSNYLRREGLLRDTHAVRVEEQLGMFMFMISHNASNERMQKLPSSNQTHPKIASDPRFYPFFKNCIGAIDSTHVPITIAEDKAPRSASDAGVLRSAITKGFHVPEGKFYLVDGGYANTPSFLASYRGVRYHLNEFRRRRSSRRREYADHKELFNHRHAILRNHIERAIGVLKKRFQILKVGTHHPIESQIKIPAAAAVFHNIIRGLNGDEDWLDHQPTYIPQIDYVDLPEGDDNYRNDVESVSLQIDDGTILRDQIAIQMWDQYNQNRA